MTRHEAGCTRNPNRVCGFCAAHVEWVGDVQHQKTLAELVAILRAEGLEKLKEAAGLCPGCTFAAIVQSRDEQRKHWTGEFWEFEPAEGWISPEKFNLKEESAAFWEVVNAAKENLQIKRSGW
jgi:hypothetical protein